MSLDPSLYSPDLLPCFFVNGSQTTYCGAICSAYAKSSTYLHGILKMAVFNEETGWLLCVLTLEITEWIQHFILYTSKGSNLPQITQHGTQVLTAYQMLISSSLSPFLKAPTGYFLHVVVFSIYSSCRLPECFGRAWITWSWTSFMSHAEPVQFPRRQRLVQR